MPKLNFEKFLIRIGFFLIIVIFFLFSEKSLKAQTPPAQKPTEPKACQAVNYSDHLDQTRVFFDNFLIELIQIKEKARDVYLNAKKIAEGASECKSENCGSKCSCPAQVGVKAQVCRTTQVQCLCASPAGCAYAGFDLDLAFEVTCQENVTKTIHRLFNIPAGYSLECWAPEPITPGPPIVINVCQDFDIGECGEQCCLGTTQNPGPDGFIPGGTVKTTYIHCINSGTCQPQPCEGKGEKKFLRDPFLGIIIGVQKQGPCPEGINEAYQKMIQAGIDFFDLYRNFLTLQAPLETLKRENLRLSQKLATWYKEKEASDLIDCFTAKALRLESLPIINCPYDGNVYYICR
jgi:hypothetical protein